MNYLNYIAEEVKRQGHDVYNVYDGGIRIAWMILAWNKAVLAAQLRLPTIADVEELGKQVEVAENGRGFRTCRVTVGMPRRECPPPERVVWQLEELTGQACELSAVEYYKAFEEIHPFRDGNGRVGKILFNWLNGTLGDPIWPPKLWDDGGPL